MHYKFGFEKTIASHRLMSRSTAKYSSDERFGTYRCETRRSKSGRVYFVLDKQINSRFRKHFSSKNSIDIRSKRDVLDGRCDIASGKVIMTGKFIRKREIKDRKRNLLINFCSEHGAVLCCQREKQQETPWVQLVRRRGRGQRCQPLAPDSANSSRVSHHSYSRLAFYRVITNANVLFLAFQQGKRASLYVTGDQHGKCSLFRKKFLKT